MAAMSIAQLRFVNGTSGTPTYTDTKIARHRSDNLHTRNFSSPITRVDAPLYGTFAAITASTSPQAVRITPTDSSVPFPYENAMLLILAAGEATQEVIRISAFDANAGTITAIFRHTRAAGAIGQCVSVGTPKVVCLNIQTAPTTHVANVCFQRSESLPKGIYDAYLLSDTFEGDSTPAVLCSTATDRPKIVPTAEKLLVYGDVFEDEGIVPVYIHLQWFFTYDSDSENIPAAPYRLLWDEA